MPRGPSRAGGAVPPLCVLFFFFFHTIMGLGSFFRPPRANRLWRYLRDSPGGFPPRGLFTTSLLKNRQKWRSFTPNPAPLVPSARFYNASSESRELLLKFSHSNRALFCLIDTPSQQVSHKGSSLSDLIDSPHRAAPWKSIFFQRETQRFGHSFSSPRHFAAAAQDGLPPIVVERPTLVPPVEGGATSSPADHG